MRTTIAMATFVAVGTGAAGVGALDNVSMKGSDTLEDITEAILLACSGTTGTTYVGGGSSSGETALISSTSQTVAPMSRFLAGKSGPPTTGVCSHAAGPSNSEGMAFALDGLAITADEDSALGCGGVAETGTIAVTDVNGDGLDCPDCTGTDYTLLDWRDALRVLYSGMHKTAGSAIANKRCGSDVRRSLALQWDTFYSGACATCTGGIKHLWRRGDRSGTTDTFLSLLGLPSMPSATTVVTPANSPFCNGGDFDDADPIRVPCEGNGPAPGPDEQVCAADNTMGLLQAVFVPEGVAGVTTADLYATTACSTGVFRYANAPTGATTCPTGSGLIFGKCLTPVTSSGGTVNFACLNSRTNRPFGTGASFDARVFNMVLRRNDGVIRRDAGARQITGAFYRMQATSTIGGNNCQEDTSTKQIGCLSQANPCSIGFAGREASELIADVVSLNVRGTAPTITNIRNLITTPSTADDYPLSRKLYLNTMIGFENVTSDELALADCFSRRSIVDPAVTAAGFVTLDDTQTLPVVCEDFADTTCGAGSNVNACADHPMPLLP